MLKFQEHYLEEMPHVATNRWEFDFEMEKPDWAQKMVKAIQDHEDEVAELLDPFYGGLYKTLFKKKFEELSEPEKDELRAVVPPNFLKDMDTH